MSEPLTVNIHGREYNVSAVPQTDPHQVPVEDLVARLQAKMKNRTPQQLSNEEAEERELRAKRERDLFAAANAPRLQAETKPRPEAAWEETRLMLVNKFGTGFIIALVGHRGPGKTQLGVELIRHAAAQCKSCQYVRAMDLFLDLKSSYRTNSETSERQVIEGFCKPRLLVIDESSERSDSDWENRILTYIIDRRYCDKKDTLLIANLPAGEFDAAMGPSIVSRVRQTGGIKNCDWPSFRK